MIIYFVSNVSRHRIAPNLMLWLRHNPAARSALARDPETAQHNRPPNRREFLHMIDLRRAP